MDQERFKALVLRGSIEEIGSPSVLGAGVVSISWATGRRFPGRGDFASFSPSLEGGQT